MASVAIGFIWSRCTPSGPAWRYASMALVDPVAPRAPVLSFAVPIEPSRRSAPVIDPFLTCFDDVMRTDAAVAVPPRATKSATTATIREGLGRCIRLVSDRRRVILRDAPRGGTRRRA